MPYGGFEVISMALEDVLKEYGGVEVSAMAVYSDMFRLGYGDIQKKNEPAGEYKANPLGYWKMSDKTSGHYRIMFDDTFEETLQELQQADFAIMNGITYFGRRNRQEHASKMYAMIFDLDGVTPQTLNAFLSGATATNYDIYPLPNYIILSGSGLHLYYLFEYGIPLYPNIKIKLKELKYALTERMWNPYTSTIKEPQYQGINQGFRVIGGKTKYKDKVVRAFQMNTHPYNLEQMNRYVSEEHRIDESKLWKESRMTLAEAKKKYPEWYKKRVEQGQPKGTWQVKRDLYDWWIRKIQNGAGYHHRYFCVMCLAIYGAKCGLEYDEVLQDAMNLIPLMNNIEPEHPFTQEDVKSAMECFDERYCTFPRADIEKLSNIQIPPNKRNGRKQDVHLERARAVQVIDYPSGEWRNKDGRPTQEQVVRTWREAHPDGKKIECYRETGLSRVTIDKWWNKPLPVLPEYYVVEGDSAIMYKLFDYADKGIRNVAVLTQEEYDEMCANEVVMEFLKDQRREKNGKDD